MAPSDSPAYRSETLEASFLVFAFQLFLYDLVSPQVPKLRVNRKFAQISTSVSGWLRVFLIRGIPGNSSQHSGVLTSRIFSGCWNLKVSPSLFCVWDWSTAHVAVISANLWPRMLSCSCSGFSISDATAQLVYARAPCDGRGVMWCVQAKDARHPALVALLLVSKLGSKQTFLINQWVCTFTSRPDIATGIFLLYYFIQLAPIDHS